MADYFEQTLPAGISDAQLGERVLDALSDANIYSVELLHRGNALIARMWFSEPYELSDHESY